MSLYSILIISFVILSELSEVWSHGRLIDPQARGTAWRYGFNTPKDYNDVQLYCGGYNNQWQSQSGKCGICGDPYQGPRSSECPNGEFCSKVIVKTYKTGEEIEAKVQLTANHYGYFIFRVCPVTDESKEVTQECLNKYELKVLGTSGTKYMLPNANTGYFTTKLTLPSGLTCSRCVFQWDYTTGNNWGTCANGTQAVGCGPQETFRGCADVKIGNDASNTATNAPTNPTTVKQTTTTQASVQSSTTKKASTTKPSTTTVKSTSGKTCRSITNEANYNIWCAENCAQNYCPDTICTCS